MRVAGGAVARLIIPEVEIVARVIEIGDATDAAEWPVLLDAARTGQDSLGAVVECIATGAGGMESAGLCQTGCCAGGGLHGDQCGQGR